MPRITAAGPAEIPEIRRIAHTSWAIAYRDILSPQQMEYMLQLFYSEASLVEQMDRQHFLIAGEDNVNTGFAAYSRKSGNTWHLHKLYVDPVQQGSGTGKALLQYIIETIRTAGATALELNVNRHNIAKQFYEKMGFSVIAEEDIDIGNGYFMNDYIMSLPIDQ